MSRRPLAQPNDLPNDHNWAGKMQMMFVNESFISMLDGLRIIRAAVHTLRNIEIQSEVAAVIRDFHRMEILPPAWHKSMWTFGTNTGV